MNAPDDELIEAMAEAIWTSEGSTKTWDDLSFVRRRDARDRAISALAVAKPVIEQRLLQRLSQTWEANVSQVATLGGEDSIDLDDWLLAQRPVEGGE